MLVRIRSSSNWSTNQSFSRPAAVRVLNEVRILQSVDHPCIIRLEDVIDTPDNLYIGQAVSVESPPIRIRILFFELILRIFSN